MELTAISFVNSISATNRPIAGECAHFRFRGWVVYIRPVAGLRFGTLGGDIERVVLADCRSLLQFHELPGRFQRYIVVRVEKINRPEQAVIDRALDFDAGSFEPVLERKQGFARFDRERYMVETERFAGAVTGKFALHHRSPFVLEKGDMRQAITELKEVVPIAIVADTGTYAEPTTVPAGIAGVWVNGQPVVDGGAITGRRPGRVVRRKGT